MERLRTPLYIVALVLGVVVVAVETGSALFTAPEVTDAQLSSIYTDAPEEARDELDLGDLRDFRNEHEAPPGKAIPHLAFLDFLLLYTLGLIGLSMLLGERLHGRIQGILSLIVSIVTILLGILAVILLFIELVVMLALFFATPFGTIAYMAIYGFFERGKAEAILGFLTLLKLALAVCLVLAHQRFLQNKGLVFLLATSLVADLVVVFLHGIVPIVLVSITDVVAAIIVVIVAIIWAIVLLISAIVSLVKVIRLGRST